MTPPRSGFPRRVVPHEVDGRTRYELLTSLVVPRPIAWVSTYDADGSRNLAPFSYYAALSASPMLVGISVGHRGGRPKDTLANVRARGAFCINVVSEDMLEAMNATSADVPPEVDEFALAGLEAEASECVDAPYVRGAPAVLECTLEREVELAEAPNTLVIGRVQGVLLAEGITFLEGTHQVDPAALRPVGRLSGSGYALPGPVRFLPRPG